MTVLIGITIITFVFSVYEMLVFTQAQKIAKALLRAATSLLFVLSSVTEDSLMRGGMVLVYLVVLMIAMSMLRNEVQVKDE